MDSKTTHQAVLQGEVAFCTLTAGIDNSFITQITLAEFAKHALNPPVMMKNSLKEIQMLVSDAVGLSYLDGII